MMLAPFLEAFKFLVQTLFNLYIFLVSLRVIFHWVRVHPANPILLLISRITYPHIATNL